MELEMIMQNIFFSCTNQSQNIITKHHNQDQILGLLELFRDY